jgi:hypothetical protein
MYTTSGKFKVDMKDKVAWKKWITRPADSPRMSSWTWYDKTFGEHMLRYVLTTPKLADFEAHRNSLMQVKEMHKVKMLAGSVDHAGHRDKKNLYINAFFILFISIHLAITKKIIGMLLCTEQPDGTYTLNESPTLVCWEGEHAGLSNLAFFFMATYGVGFPLFCIFTISNIFKLKREFDPDMRDRYGYLYYKYKTTHFYWEPVVIMPRKVFIALFRILTRRKEYHLLQASGIMILLSCLAILQIKQLPFIEVFLNNMENVALSNHVFVLFFGVMFLSKALEPSDPGQAPSIMSESAYAFIMIGHMSMTFAYLFHGVFKELWEMGLFQTGFNDLQNMILQQRGDSMKLIKRTARSHWALRPLASLFSKSHKKVDDMATENSKKKNVSSAKINQPGQRHYPPPPPRSVPLAIDSHYWICDKCTFENTDKNNLYSYSCMKCKENRPFSRFKSKLSLAEKKRALGYELDILKSILLAHEAQDAAISWGIDDRSTTLRETIWLLRALEVTCKNVLQVFFNVKQLDKQKEMRKQRATLIGNITLIFLPLVMAFKYLKEFFQNRRGIYKKHVYRNWVKRRDPVSRTEYFIYKDEYVLVQNDLTVNSQGWYEFFDGESRTPYYAYLGEFGWQHASWKIPHESNRVPIQHGPGRKGRGPMIVTHQPPSKYSKIDNMKTTLLTERLNEYDSIMEKLGSILSDGSNQTTQLPQFYIFKEMLADLLEIDMIRSTLDTQYGSDANIIRREAARLCISMPMFVETKQVNNGENNKVEKLQEVKVNKK